MRGVFNDAYVICVLIFGRVFKKNPSFEITMSGRAGVGHRPRLTFWLTVFQSYVTFILQWIAFIFGRDEEEDQ